MFKAFLFVGGFFHLLFLLGNDEVRAFQMHLPCFLLACATLHLQTLCHHILHTAHILFAQFAGLACLVVHPVPYDVGVVVGFPCVFVTRYVIMPFIPVNEYL